MKKQSLTGRTIRITVTSSILFALVAMFIGLSIYGSGLLNEYISRSFQIAKHARFAAFNVADTESLSRQVMDIYHSLTPEQRAADDYLDHYNAIDTSLETGSDYDFLHHMLQGYIIGVDDVYIGMYDLPTNSLVYIVDPDRNGKTSMPLGSFDAVSEEECRKFLEWNGEGMLYDISDTEKYGWMCTAGYPLKDQNGEIFAFILADVMLNTLTSDLGVYIVRIGIALLAATVLIAWFVSRHMKKTVAEPLNAIAKAAADYVEDRKRGVERKHFTAPETNSGYEIENLTGVMADMERDLAQHEAELTRITAERERITTELNMAKGIQESVLPSVFPPYPDRSEFSIYASMKPAREVGGDFYDFYLIDNDHLCIVMADVSGKGIPAALFMMTSKTTIQNCAMMGNGAAEILKNTNAAICSNNQVQMFVTVWVGILEISTGKVTAANAGHEYPALMKNGIFDLYKDKHGFVIGGLENVNYKEYELMLEPGDKLFVYTDGVTEATNTDNQLFGTERMIVALNSDSKANPERILENVHKAVDGFVKDGEQFDDITMLCLEYHGKKENT